MAVNGKGTANDQTSWTVKTLGGVVLNDSKRKPLTGLKAADAFAAVRSNRLKGVWAAAVRA